MPFKPGQSGNPNGRPKVTLPDGRSLSEVAKEHTAVAVEALVSIVRNKRVAASARVQAATALLDRGWGRPHQTVVANVESLSAAERVRRGRLRAQEMQDQERRQAQASAEAARGVAVETR